MLLTALWDEVRIMTAKPSILKKAEEALKADGWIHESRDMSSNGLAGHAYTNVWERITAPDGRVCETVSGLKRNGTDHTVLHDYKKVRRMHIMALLNGIPGTPKA